MTKPTCKVCDKGTLQQKTVFRLGGIIATIGFILLIPSFLGMLFGGLMMLSTFSAGYLATTADAAGVIGALGSSSLCVFISSFVGGLLGWLLILRKKILQCNNCGATVAAS